MISRELRLTHRLRQAHGPIANDIARDSRFPASTVTICNDNYATARQKARHFTVDIVLDQEVDSSFVTVSWPHPRSHAILSSIIYAQHSYARF